MRLLIANVLILYPPTRLKGYIYIEGGEVRAIGEGDPPEEYQYADLVIGGENRIVIPGFVYGLGFLEAYPLRDLISTTGMDFLYSNEARIITNNYGEEHAYYSALMALYELSSSGFTDIVAVDPHVLQVAEAFRKSGLHGAILVPVGCKYSLPDWKKLLDELTSRSAFKHIVRPGVFICRNAEVKLDDLVSRYDEELIVYVDSGNIVEVFKLGNRVVEKLKLGILKLDGRFVEAEAYGYGVPWLTDPFKALSLALAYMELRKASKLVEAMTTTLWRLIYGSKIPSSLVVIDASEPPCWLPQIENMNTVLLSLCSPRIEAVISKGNVVVDTGTNVHIGSADVTRAREVLTEARERIRKEGGA